MHRASIARDAKKTGHLHLVPVLFAILFVTITSVFIWRAEKVKAAGPSITVQEINYENSTITLKSSAGDSAIYFSDSRGKTWESIPGELKSDQTITMDISWISPSSKYTIKFKGNVSTDIVSVVIPKQLTTFKATYNRVKGTVTYSNQGSRLIQWRKKDSYLWNTVNQAIFANDLEMLCTQGATVYLRLAPITGKITNGVLDVGERPSKEVSIMIPKKTAAPSIVINGSKFIIPVAKNLAYRVVAADGSKTEWATINSSTDLLLSNTAASALYTNATTAQSEVMLQFRKNVSSSAQVSQITTVTIPIQEGPPNEEESGIDINYTSSTSLALTVKAASATKPFEYAIVKPEGNFNYQELTWNSITSSTAVTISETKAPKGSHIYVRKACVQANGDRKFSLASKETDVTGSAGINYPQTAVATELTTLITTAGVCNANNSTGNLTFTLYSSTKTTVSSISLRDQYGNVKGSVSCKSSVSLNSNATSEADQYIITTKITSTENVDNLTETKLYADIKLSNQDTVVSTTTTGIMLYLYPKTIVNNEEDDTYMNAFQRILYSTEASDDSSFTFQLDFGKSNVMDSSIIDKNNSTLVALDSISYDSYQLVRDSDYTVDYDSYTNAEGEDIRTATVTIDVAQFEALNAIKIKGRALPIRIKLNNGEILDNQVTINLVETATLVTSPIAWSITERSLETISKSTVTNPDNTTTTVETEVVTFAFELKIFSNDYAVSISDVTWGGQSVLKSAEISDGKAVVYLSNAKIKALETTSTTTNNLVITLSNGYEIKNGYKLTIIDAD